MIQSPRRKETWNEEQTVFHKNRMSCRYSCRSFLIEKPPLCAVRLKIKENRWHSTAPHPSATHKKRVCVRNGGPIALDLLSWISCNELFSCPDVVMWWQNTRCQKTRENFISKMLRPLLLLLLLSAFYNSSPLWSNFIFTSAQYPVSESADSGRADGGGQLGWLSLCPWWLPSLRPSISVRGKNLRNTPPPPPSPSSFHSRGACLRGTSVLNGAVTQYWLAPQVFPLGRVGSSLSSYFFFPVLLPRPELWLSAGE